MELARADKLLNFVARFIISRLPFKETKKLRCFKSHVNVDFSPSFSLYCCSRRHRHHSILAKSAIFLRNLTWCNMVTNSLDLIPFLDEHVCRGESFDLFYVRCLRKSKLLRKTKQPCFIMSLVENMRSFFARKIFFYVRAYLLFLIKHTLQSYPLMLNRFLSLFVSMTLWVRHWKLF